MSPNSIHVYCYFNGMSMSLPFGRPESYRGALDLAISLVGPDGRTGGRDGPGVNVEETFYLKTREQLDVLCDLQRECRAKFPEDFERD